MLELDLDLDGELNPGASELGRRRSWWPWPRVRSAPVAQLTMDAGSSAPAARLAMDAGELGKRRRGWPWPRRKLGPGGASALAAGELAPGVTDDPGRGRGRRRCGAGGLRHALRLPADALVLPRRRGRAPPRRCGCPGHG